MSAIVSVEAGIVQSVNVSAIRTIDIGGKAVTTAILKTPVAGRVRARGQALYAYASEDYAWWTQVLERDLPPGTFGENLTLRGVDVSGARIGERWRVGSALLCVTAPRIPCFKLAHVMNDPRFVRAFAQALRPGTYLRIIEEGDIAAGDSVDVVSRPDRELTVVGMARIYFFDREHARDMLLAPDLTDSWRAWAIEHGG